MARTVTGTATFSRFSLLEMQVRALLRETAGASEAVLQKVSRGLDSPHYIETVAVHGLWADGTLGAELRMEIDWRVHALAVKAGGSQVQVPNSWTSSVAPSLNEAVRTFNQAVSFAGLSIEWVVTYGMQFDADEVNRMLGFVRAKDRTWRRQADSIDLGFGPLHEASLVVRLAID